MPASFVLCAAAIAVASPKTAHAQSSGSLLVAPVLPPGFASAADQGVAERSRPDWQALGVRLGAFTLKPRATIAAGATSNAYLTRDGSRSSAFVSSSTDVELTSDWSRHYLSLHGNALVNKYVGNGPLDTTGWALGAAGRYDIHSTLQVAATADVTRDNESRFEGESISANFAVSPFIRETALIRANYNPGRAGLQLTADYRHLHFLPVTFQDGTRAGQSVRDRSLAELVAQGTFASTPSFALFGQASVSRTRFDVPGPPQLLQSDSDGFRLLGGVNLAMEGIATGSIGVGWSRRDYSDARIGTHSGLSVEALVELFPKESTTVTLNARRQLSDANPTSGPYWETFGGATVDREVRRNIIVSATGGYTRQHYLDSLSRDSSALYGGLSGTYLIARSMEVHTNLIFRSSRAKGQPSLSEARGSVGLTFKI